MGPETEKPSARPDKWSSSMIDSADLLIPALATNDFEMLAVADGDVVAEKGPAGEVVATIQLELPAGQNLFQKPSQIIWLLIKPFLFFGHLMFLPAKRKKGSPGG